MRKRQIFFIVILLCGCTVRKGDSFRLSERDFALAVDQALQGDFLAGEKLVDYFGFYQFNEKCFMEWRYYLASKGAKQVLSPDEALPSEFKAITGQCKKRP